MDTDTITLVGRGPSAFSHEFADGPHMAISSGIFAFPEGVVPLHFATIDVPKFYMLPLTEYEISWGEDRQARHWPFWKDSGIVKHILVGRNIPGYYRNIPRDIVDRIPEKWREAVKPELDKITHEAGFQPQWGDFPNTTGWPMDRRFPPNFDASGAFGLDGLCNSTFFAIQIAHRLGYRRIAFVGVDLADLNYREHLAQLERWHAYAIYKGKEWVNLAPKSALRHFIPTVCHA